MTNFTVYGAPMFRILDERCVHHYLGVLGEDAHIEVQGGKDRRSRDPGHRLPVSRVDRPQAVPDHFVGDRIQIVVGGRVQVQDRGHRRRPIGVRPVTVLGPVPNDFGLSVGSWVSDSPTPSRVTTTLPSASDWAQQSLGTTTDVCGYSMIEGPRCADRIRVGCRGRWESAPTRHQCPGT